MAQGSLLCTSVLIPRAQPECQWPKSHYWLSASLITMSSSFLPMFRKISFPFSGETTLLYTREFARPWFLLLLQFFLLYSLDRLKKKKNLYLCSWNQGNFLTKRVGREWQKNKKFKDSLRWGGRYAKMGLYSRKNSVSLKRLDGETIINEKNPSEGRDKKSYRLGLSDWAPGWTQAQSRLPHGHQPCCSLRHISFPMKTEDNHEITSECAWEQQGIVDCDNRDKKPFAHLLCIVPNGLTIVLQGRVVVFSL